MRLRHVALPLVAMLALVVGVPTAAAAPRAALAAPSYTLVASADLARWASDVAAAWSKNTGVTVTVGTDCSGPYCLKAQLAGVTCGTAGCATPPSTEQDYCRVDVNTITTSYASDTMFNVFAHESGHCVIGALGGGYSWHASNTRDLMAAYLDPGDRRKRITSETTDYMSALLGA